MSDDPGQGGRPSREGDTPDGTQGHQTGDVGSGALDNEPITPHLHRQPNFRGHIVVDYDEPLLVFDAPADPPPVPPAAPDGQATQG